MTGETPKPIDVDLTSVVAPDLGTVDALARLQLAAARAGCVVRLHHAAPPLWELLEFTGLSGAFMICECNTGRDQSG